MAPPPFPAKQNFKQARQGQATSTGWLEEMEGWQGQVKPTVESGMAVVMVPVPLGGAAPNIQSSPVANQQINWQGLKPLPEAQSQQNQPASPTQKMQVIALPMGTAPPEGAIPLGPVPAGMENTLSSQSVEVIAVPKGQSPPMGAVPISQYGMSPNAKAEPWQTPSKSESWQNHQNSPNNASWQGSPKSDNWPDEWNDERWISRQAEPWQDAAKIEPAKASPKNNRFKIKDPRTGKVILPPDEEATAAPRRLRIVNPLTGEEVKS